MAPSSVETGEARRDPLVSPEYHEYSEHSTTYRGFSTSITGSFQSLQEERVDACSLVCCGILQADRDRYLLTGVRPPSCCRRIVTHLILPLSLFLFAGYCAMRIPDPAVNQFLSTAFVLLIIGYLILQCCKGRWKRQKVRKELLWRKYHKGSEQRLLLHIEQDNDEISIADSNYLQGQSKWDILCAHMLVGCYTTDITYRSGTVSEERPPFEPPNNLCGCLWNALTIACCGALCGTHLQVCGMCALAQEGREVERILPNLPRLDYMTYQPVLEYAPSLWSLREAPATPWQAHFTTLSRLSKDTLKNGLLALVATALLFPGNRVVQVVMVTLTVAYALVFLAAVHWPFHRNDVSVDALIKYFASGFLLASTMAVTWELVVGLCLRLIMMVVLAISGIDVEYDNDYTTHGLVSFASAQTMAYKDYLLAFAKQHPIIYTLYLWVNAYCMAALVEEICKYFGYRVVDHVDVWSAAELEKAVALGVPQVQHLKEHDEEESSKGAEEGNCCGLTDQAAASDTTPPTTTPPVPTEAPKRTVTSIGYAVTISMVAVGLGFACCENLVYIFLYTTERGLGSKMAVLLMRICMPVHPICAAIQSIGVCQRDLENDSQHQLGRIIFPSIMVHGTFDFVLMFFDFLSNQANDGWEWTGIALAMFILLASCVYYLRMSRAQQERLERMDHADNVDQSNLL